MNLKTFSKMVSDYSHFNTKLNKTLPMAAELPPEGQYRRRSGTISGNSLLIRPCPMRCPVVKSRSCRKVCGKQAALKLVLS